MADFVLFDRVKETSTSTGTLQMTLAGPVAGFLSFSSQMPAGTSFNYLITGGAEWEVGLGHYFLGDVYRDSVYIGSNGSSPVNFSAGQKEISIVVPAKLLIASHASAAYASPKTKQYGSSLAVGPGASAGQAGIAMGFGADAGYSPAGNSDLALGNNAKANGGSSISIGNGAEVASGASYSAAIGSGAKARQPCQRVACAHDVFTLGHAARIATEIGALTTNATPTEMLATLGLRGTKMIYGSAWAFTAMIVAFRDSDGTAFGKKIEGMIKQNASATTSLVGTPIETVLGDDFAGALAVSASADNTNGALKLTVTGLAGATIRWHANIEAAAVGFY